MARNATASAVLAKEGVIATVSGRVLGNGLSAAPYCPKLKVALEALVVLTRPPTNLAVFASSSDCARPLFEVFTRYEDFVDKARLAAKIVGAVLNLFLHLASSSAGRRHFCSAGGIAALKRFCLTLTAYPDRRWDRLLCRAVAVVSRCCDKKRLPLDSMACPFTFQAPEGTEEDKKRSGT